jgi:hypothetical protein
MAGQSQEPLATKDRRRVLKAVVSLGNSIKGVFMRTNLLKDATEFEKRLKAGQEKLLSPKESAQRLAAALKAQKELLDKCSPK